MSRYDLDSIIQQATSMDVTSSLPSTQPRWQRKNDSQIYNSFNVSNVLNQTNDLLSNMTLADNLKRLNETTANTLSGVSSQPLKTPGKTPNSKRSSQQSNSKVGLTPAGKTPSRHNGSQKPMPKTPKTPIHSGMDRYITNRNGMDLEKSHYLMTQANKNEQENDPNLRERLGANLDQYRIMCYTDKAPVSQEGPAPGVRVAYSSSKNAPSAKKATRVIPTQPEKILDAPELVNDWYLNLVSWGSSNLLAVALSSAVYLWNATTGDIKCLMQTPENDYVSSLSWIQEGNHLAVGTSLNCVEIWDAESGSRLRKMAGHSQRVSSLDWNAHLLSSGSKSGQIFHHDVRIPEHHVGTLNGHTGHEICGLKWSPDGKYLASGANDNKVNIWSGVQMTLDSASVKPLQELGHTSAVKAIAWCPWKPHLIATGAGTTDKHIRIWNASNKNCLYSVDTKSQISGLEWNEEYQELISAHGFQNNELNIWKFPTMTKVAELRGHTHRVLGLCMSPDRSTVVSLAADETLRFWECFPIDTTKKKKVDVSAKKTSINPIRMSLR
jgi:cell division cycle protein 20 (cofactor of APC complex)